MRKSLALRAAREIFGPTAFIEDHSFKAKISERCVVGTDAGGVRVVLGLGRTWHRAFEVGRATVMHYANEMQMENLQRWIQAKWWRRWLHRIRPFRDPRVMKTA